MNAADLPPWAALAVSALVLASAFFTLLGTLGLVRLSTFYERVHAPTLGASFGVILMALGSGLFFTVLQARPVVHEALIIAFITLTTPVTLMLLTRAALQRDEDEGRAKVSDDVASVDRERDRDTSR